MIDMFGQELRQCLRQFCPKAIDKISESILYGFGQDLLSLNTEC